MEAQPLELNVVLSHLLLISMCFVFYSNVLAHMIND